MSFRAHLDELVSARGYALDAAQRKAADRLARLDEEWVTYKHARRNALLKLVARPEIPRGVYLWGSVGRGKSFLMDCFFATVPLIRKTRDPLSRVHARGAPRTRRGQGDARSPR